VPADGTGARLAEIEPPRDVDLLEIELEQGITRDRLDHSPPPLAATTARTMALAGGSPITTAAGSAAATTRTGRFSAAGAR